MGLALLAAAWLAGLLIGLNRAPEPFPILLLFLAALAFAAVLRLCGRSALVALLAAFFLLGMIRPHLSASTVLPLTPEEKRTVTVIGHIDEDPQQTDRQWKFAFTVESVEGLPDVPEDEPRGVRILVFAGPSADLVVARDAPYFRYGDQLQLTGVLERPKPIEEFDYPAYLASQDIQAILWARESELLAEGRGPPGLSLIYSLRHRLSKSLESALPEPHASLAQALLLGQRGQIPDELTESFRRTGTSHLLAISGMHVGILMLVTLGASAFVFGRRRQLYLLAPLGAIWLYAAVSGLPPSALRAAIMGSVLLTAIALGRPRSLLPALALAAFAMTAWEPLMLTQISFQLSFAAMAGIVLALPAQERLKEYIEQSNRLSTILPPPVKFLLAWTASALLVSLAATLATMPLVALNFERLPVFGILVTLLAIPALPLILVSSLVAALGGMVHSLLGQALGWIAWVPLSYLSTLVSAAPGTAISAAWMGHTFLGIWYAILAGLLFLPHLLRTRIGRWHRNRSQQTSPTAIPRWRPGRIQWVFAAGFVVTASVSVLLLSHVSKGPDGLLHVHFFDVGQGDSILIVTPGGRQMLVDGGPEAQSATRALSSVLSPLDRGLDLVALTHIDSDHSQGLLQVVDRYRVQQALLGSPAGESATAARWETTLENSGVTPIALSAGYQIELEPGLVIQVLNPPPPDALISFAKTNNSGLVLRLVYGEISLLLTADIEEKTERYLAESTLVLNSDVLKVAHHGSKTSTSEAFLRKVNPSMAIISAGSENRFGHPHDEVMDRLQKAVDEKYIFRTDHHGDIEVISDGANLWVKTQNQIP